MFNFIESPTSAAEMYISMEGDYELRQKEAKIERAKKVEDAAEYLTGAFWWYAKDVDTYNYTQTEYVIITCSRMTCMISLI